MRKHNNYQRISLGNRALQFIEIIEMWYTYFSYKIKTYKNSFWSDEDSYELLKVCSVNKNWIEYGQIKLLESESSVIDLNLVTSALTSILPKPAKLPTKLQSDHLQVIFDI